MNTLAQLIDRRREAAAIVAGRVVRFIVRAYKFRSLSLALWVDAYENHTPKY